MFKKMNTVVAALILSVATTAFTTEWKSFEEYEKDMKSKGNPLTLIIGCGHSNRNNLEGDHIHKNCWTINIKNPADVSLPDPSKPRSLQLDEINKYGDHNPFWEFTKANQELDISISQVTNGLKNMLGKFDNVVLERPWDKTLNQPWTIFNATQLLKTNGLFYIDVHYTYRYDLYESNSDFCKSVTPELNYFDSNTHLYDKKNIAAYVLFDVKSNCKVSQLLNNKDIELENNSMESMLNGMGLDKDKTIYQAKELVNIELYLNTWFFRNIISLKNINSPFTVAEGQEIVKGRIGNMLIAQKTEDTHKASYEWLGQLKKIKK